MFAICFFSEGSNAEKRLPAGGRKKLLNLGYLIGRRGDTLDAIQHLCNYAVNRDVEGHVRVNVDAESYREKREEYVKVMMVQN